MAATERLFLGNLQKYDLPKHPDGVATRLIQEGVAPAFDDGFAAALKAGRLTVLPSVEKMDGDAVFFTNGSAIRPDAVICATGYRPGLEGLVSHLGVLDETGHPTHPGPIPHPVHKGLWFMGMTPRLPGVFYAARGEAKQLTRKVQRSLGPREVTFTRQAFSRAMM